MEILTVLAKLMGVLSTDLLGWWLTDRGLQGLQNWYSLQLQIFTEDWTRSSKQCGFIPLLWNCSCLWMPRSEKLALSAYTTYFYFKKPFELNSWYKLIHTLNLGYKVIHFQKVSSGQLNFIRILNFKISVTQTWFSIWVADLANVKRPCISHGWQ